MTAEHYNELIELSRKIYSADMDMLTNHLCAKYCAVGNDTTQLQLEDWMCVAIETSAYFLGNVMALLTPDSQEKEIGIFTEKLRNVIQFAQQKADIGDKPS